MTETDAQHGNVIENWLNRASVVAGYLAALAGFVYLVGGVVMWLRFRTADLPADQGVALMSREQLFVVGLRLMILPLLVAGALVFVLALRVSNERTHRLIHWAGVAVAVAVLLLLVVWTFGVVGWPPGLAVVLAVLVPTGVACAMLMLDRQVAGSVRLSAWGSGGGVKPLGTRALKPAAKTGVARIKATLPAGAWRLEARYISAAGIAYPQALDTAAVTTTAGRPADGGAPAPVPDTAKPST